MAYAGNPTDLAKQPAATTNGLWQALIAAIVLLALGAGLVMVTSNISSNKGSALPAADHRYDGIESQRGATTLSQVAADRRFDELMLAPAVAPDRRFDELIVGAAAPFADSSYDQVEGNRGAALTAADGSTDMVEGLRGGANLSGPAVDHSYDTIEGHRGAVIFQ